MALSDLRSRISSAFPTTKVEESLDKVFKDRKLLNLVTAYLSATDSALDFYECTKTFLRKAKDDERTVEESLRGFGKDSSVSALQRSLNFESCFEDMPFIEDFIQKRNNFWKQVSNLEKLIARLMDSSFSIGKWVSRAVYIHPKRNYARQRRSEILSEVNEDVSAFRFYSKMVLDRIHLMSIRVEFRAMEMLEGELKFLEGEEKLLKIKIEDLEQWMDVFGQVVEVSRFAVYEKIMEFLSDVSCCKERE